MKTNKKAEKIPKKRKWDASFHCRKKCNRPGRTIVRLGENGIVHSIENHFTSTEANSNRDYLGDCMTKIKQFYVKIREGIKRTFWIISE